MSIVYVLASNEAMARHRATSGQSYASSADAQRDLAWINNVDGQPSAIKVWAIETDGIQVRSSSIIDAIAACVWMIAALALPAIGSML